jgi:predicted Fe-S protein YdhL (DUF1289 family)
MMKDQEETYQSGLDRAIEAARAQQPVGSPCIDICRLNPQTGLCEGCLRSRDEIKAWRTMTDYEKLKVLDGLVARCD